ncbi:YidC/Oxa1 family membrane protein insertase [Staphylococcus gallinarum]|uniref:YidC/Oxa1 family membrane protein insertase n=1 Tax=Staphylococcus gallinarum TaxID=1293 RepID=UPI00217568FD|nr:YidC/Oxa1 family membrane protein insertase [Staphylococcus gallinarum]
MHIVKPEMTKIQENMVANQEMMEKYKACGMNPMKTMLGSLPLLVQMPILYGLYVSLKWPSSRGLTDHAYFLWFNLTQPDIWITIIANILHIIQPVINFKNMPTEQRSMGNMMTIFSLIFIIYISITSASTLVLY